MAVSGSSEFKASVRQWWRGFAGGGNSTKATLRVTRQNQAEEQQNRTKMVAEHVGFKTNQEDRLRVAKARKDLFKYASDRKHKALLRQVSLRRWGLGGWHFRRFRSRIENRWAVQECDRGSPKDILGVMPARSSCAVKFLSLGSVRRSSLSLLASCWSRNISCSKAWFWHANPREDHEEPSQRDPPTGRKCA